MPKEHSHAGQENKRERRIQPQPISAGKEPVPDQNAIFKLQSALGNQGVQSLLKAGRLDHLKSRPASVLPPVRGALQPKHDHEEEEVVEEETPEFSSMKSPAGAYPPGPPDAGRPLTISRVISAAPIQRELNDEQKAIWDAGQGDQQLATLKGHIETWKAWRKLPVTNEGMPKGEGLNLAGFVDLINSDPAFKQHIVQELGGESIQYLTEMASFHSIYNSFIGVIPGVSHVDAAHTYELEMTDARNSILNYYPIGHLEVNYSNAFGWRWTKALQGMLFGSVGLSLNADVFDLFKDLINSKDASKKKTLKRWLKQIPTLFNPPGALSIEGKAVARHISYWGLDDLAGMVGVINGPSVSGAAAGFSGKTAAGSAVHFMGSGAPGAPLMFESFTSEFAWKPEYDTPDTDNLLDAVDASLSISIVEQGLGAVWSSIEGGDMLAIPNLEPRAVLSEKQWRYNIGPFDVGSPEPPSTMEGYLNELKQAVENHKQDVESDKEVLEELGAYEAFKVDFLVEGYASRPWLAAANDAERLQKNLVLSQDRANAVASHVNGMFADVMGSIAAVGLGAAGMDITTGQLLVEDRDKDKIDALIEEREDKRAVGTGPTGEYEKIRRVVVTALWRGNVVEWGGANMTTAPVPRPDGAPLDTSGGGGGTEGSGPAYTGVGGAVND